MGYGPSVTAPSSDPVRARTSRRRTSAETRQLLLDAAVGIVLRRVAGDASFAAHPLAAVRITDALNEVNERTSQDDPTATPMTTGAAYNIWPRQADFQLDVMAAILDRASVPGLDEVNRTLAAGTASGAPWRDVAADTLRVSFDVSYDEPTMFVFLGLNALAPPAELTRLNASADRRFVEVMSATLGALLEYGGRRLAAGRRLEDLVWAVEALWAGYLLRRRIHPHVLDRPDAAGRGPVESAGVALLEAWSEPLAQA